MNAIRSMRYHFLACVHLIAFALLLSSCQNCPPGTLCTGVCTEDDARVCRKPTIRALASDIDSLERQIECFGSVSIQHPTVWGQARLTAHRQDYESQMAQELPNFASTLNASLSRSDQAYAATAIALSMTPGSAPKTTTLGAISSPITTGANNAVSPFDAFGAISRSGVTLPAPAGFGNIAKPGLTLEPTVYLNQKNRYINYLNEFRRINEGDDTADSPGYALNLIRIPVSVLPGKCTQEGHAAEVSLTLKPQLSPDLLPTTFRNLVLNDLVEQIGVPVTQLLNDSDQFAAYILADIERKKVKSQTQNTKKDLQPSPIASTKTKMNGSQGEVRFRNALFAASAQSLKDSSGKMNSVELQSATTAMVAEKLQAARVATAPPSLAIPRLSATKLKQSRKAFPSSQVFDVYGQAEFFNLVEIAAETLTADIATKYWIHFPDVQGYLQDELGSAYNFLKSPENSRLWAFCSQELVQQIHARNVDALKETRDRYADQVLAMSNRKMDSDVTVMLSWAIIVHSALLTDQLTQDMKEALAAKGHSEPVPFLDYFLPAPSLEAREAFNRYVECRWPIIVFALDPVTEQQNVGDTYSSRRERQLALALAYISGHIGTNAMNQYARRLEMDLETIALNNTAAGFSHGNETFGWRFYPRIQTPDAESNLKVRVRDLFVGGPGRDAILRQQKLEPGIRECHAVVIMPSFVPYATLEVSSCWCALTNPKHKCGTTTDAVALSARVHSIEKCAHQTTDADCYLDGEMNRLLNRAKQLEARLPMRSMRIQVPYENTLGGFAMFNTGVTDLAPEIYGWYGAPGISTTDNTTLFLVGNHFNVTHTQVIVGGVPVTPQLISRQVLSVTIPKGATTIDRQTGKFADTPNTNEPFVDVHVATPYGVTSHLLVPALGKLPSANGSAAEAGGSGSSGGSATGSGARVGTDPRLSWSPKAIDIGFVSKGVGISVPNPPTVRPADVKIKLANPIVSNPFPATATLYLDINGMGIDKYSITLSGATVSKNQTILLTDGIRDSMVTAIIDKVGRQYGIQSDGTKASPGEKAKVTLTKIAFSDTYGNPIPQLQMASLSVDLLVNWVPSAEEKQQGITVTNK